jgi:uncharacterized protein (DUF433 family)
LPENGLKHRVVRDPAILVGKPTIKGTRISVALVLQYLADNPDFNEIFEAYPHLTLEDVRACLAYAGDHLERSFRRERASKRKSG